MITRVESARPLHIKSKDRPAESEKADNQLTFAEHLSIRGYIDEKRSTDDGSGKIRATRMPLSQLWQSTELSSHEFANEVAAFFGLKRLMLPALAATRSLTDRFSPRFLREASMYPFETADGKIAVAVGDPDDEEALQAAELVFGGPFEIVRGLVRGYCRGAFGEGATRTMRRRAPPSGASAGGADESIDNLRDLASGAPVVRAVNDLMEKAVELRASDIHIEPFRDGLTVRMRVDGLLRAIAGAVARAAAGADFAHQDSRRPQHRRAAPAAGRRGAPARRPRRDRHPRRHDADAARRIRGHPPAAARPRPARHSPSSAFRRATRRRCGALLDLPHGMIVVTGPTGSGKTTTLATMLSALNTPSRKILTIEDPVEYEIPGINQSPGQARDRPHLRHGDARLRAPGPGRHHGRRGARRRDREHRRSMRRSPAISCSRRCTPRPPTAAVPRLLDLGVEGFLLEIDAARGDRAAARARALRPLQDDARALSRADLDADPRYEALRPRAGRDGVRAGRAASAAAASAIAAASAFSRFSRSRARSATWSARIPIAQRSTPPRMRAGMTTMIDDAIAKCRAGVTSVAEVLRVTTIAVSAMPTFRYRALTPSRRSRQRLARRADRGGGRAVASNISA